MKHRPLTFVWLSPNVADGNRIARGVSTSLLPKGSDDVGKNRKAGETPARARHCDWGAPRHGVGQSLSRLAGMGRRRRVMIQESGDLPR
jgi:hypothetical protein